MNKSSMFSGLRDFFILWSSQSVSRLGAAMTSYALIVWVYTQIRSLCDCTFLFLNGSNILVLFVGYFM
jgi:hypothetical protein